MQVSAVRAKAAQTKVSSLGKTHGFSGQYLQEMQERPGPKPSYFPFFFPRLVILVQLFPQVSPPPPLTSEQNLVPVMHEPQQMRVTCRSFLSNMARSLSQEKFPSVTYANSLLESDLLSNWLSSLFTHVQSPRQPKGVLTPFEIGWSQRTSLPDSAGDASRDFRCSAPAADVSGFRTTRHGN